MARAGAFGALPTKLNKTRKNGWLLFREKVGTFRSAPPAQRAATMPPKKKDEPAEALGAARFGRVRNNLKMGVVGLPNVGKSSLFNLLTDQSIAAENFPFCTIEPNEARCAVPDERYDYLCQAWKPPSEYPAYLHVTDIAGLVRGAAEGAGLGNAFLRCVLHTGPHTTASAW